MNVKGKHVFQVDQATLWSYLMDPQVLEKITPGDTQLELIGDDQYRSNSNIKIGPVKGVFEGKLSVEDKVEPNSFVIKMQQNSKMGNAQGKIAMNLVDQGSGATELSFDGKANLSGMIARTGQRVLSGVANAITQEVFASSGHNTEFNLKLR